MKLYFSPLACSLATRITAEEAGVSLDYIEVDPDTKRTEDGVDYATIHPLALVPLLVLDDGELLTENAAILQYIADRWPDAGLAPRDPAGRTRLHSALSFIGTELHKAVFQALLDRNAPQAVKEYALARAAPRLDQVAARLDGREHLLDRFSVADAYLFAVLNWALVTPIDLRRWPSITTYRARLLERPAVARAMGVETEHYRRAKAV